MPGSPTPVRTGPTRPPIGGASAAEPPRVHGPGRAGAGGAAVARRPAEAVGRWTAEPGGVVAREAGPFRLVVHPDGPDGCARFLVLHHPGDTRARQPVLLASGHGDGAEAAMHAAERTAARLAGEAGRRVHTGPGRWG